MPLHLGAAHFVLRVPLAESWMMLAAVERTNWLEDEESCSLLDEPALELVPSSLDVVEPVESDVDLPAPMLAPTPL